MEPADGKGLNYKLIEKKPLKFYDQVLNQDVIKKKVFKDREHNNIEDSRVRSPERDIITRYHMHEDGLQYAEEKGKRGIGLLAETCKVTIEESNLRKSQSPRGRRSDDNMSNNNGNNYAVVSATNLYIPTNA